MKSWEMVLVPTSMFERRVQFEVIRARKIHIFLTS